MSDSLVDGQCATCPMGAQSHGTLMLEARADQIWRDDSSMLARFHDIRYLETERNASVYRSPEVGFHKQVPIWQRTNDSTASGFAARTVPGTGPGAGCLASLATSRVSDREWTGRHENWD